MNWRTVSSSFHSPFVAISTSSAKNAASVVVVVADDSQDAMAEVVVVAAASAMATDAGAETVGAGRGTRVAIG